MGWKVCLWARMLDGNHAFKMIGDQLRLVHPNADKNFGPGGGTYPNMFDAHPPFQIDGNFGECAGIAEMLIQSHTGVIDILPALPDKWADGQFCGLRARGGYTVDVRWEAGKVVSATIKSDFSKKAVARINGKDIKVKFKDGVWNYIAK